MNSKSFVLLALGSTLLGLVAPLASAADVNIYADIRLGRAAPPPPPEVVVIQDSRPPGPPPWARSRMFRRSREYYYYPAADVYYRPTDRTWFYLDGGAWRIGHNLPPSVHVDFGRSVLVTMASDRPYEYAEKVRAYYPRDYFVSRVRIKERPGQSWDRDRDDHRRDDDRRDHDRRDNDRGRGKGHDKDR